MTRRIGWLLLGFLSATALSACSGRTPYLLSQQNSSQSDLGDELPLTQPPLTPPPRVHGAGSLPTTLSQSVSTLPTPTPAVSRKLQGSEEETPAIMAQAAKLPAHPKLPRSLPAQPKATSSAASPSMHQTVSVPVQPVVFKAPEGQPRVAVSTPAPDKATPLVRALECVLANQHSKALDHLQAYDRPTQELFLRLLPTMALLSQKKVGDLSKGEIAVLQKHLDELRDQLQPRNDLVIDQACFCSWVKSFGNFAPLPQNHVFLAGEQNRLGERVQLYVELRNFRNERRNGYFETRLASSVEIASPTGDQLWQHQFEDQRFPINSRSRLHDYYNNYSFYIPALPAGNYTLTVQIVDETDPHARRTVRKSLPLRVNSLPRP